MAEFVHDGMLFRGEEGPLLFALLFRGAFGDFGFARVVEVVRFERLQDDLRAVEDRARDSRQLRDVGRNRNRARSRSPFDVRRRLATMHETPQRSSMRRLTANCLPRIRSPSSRVPSWLRTALGTCRPRNRKQFWKPLPVLIHGG